MTLLNILSVQQLLHTTELKYKYKKLQNGSVLLCNISANCSISTTIQNSQQNSDNKAEEFSKKKIWHKHTNLPDERQIAREL